MYNLTKNYGVSIILFTLITKIILFFFAFKGKRGMMQQQRLIPKQKELEKQYKDDKQKYQLALNKLYQDEGVSPMGGCLWTLLPFPIMIALYSVVQQPLTNLMKLPGDAVGKVAEFLGKAANSSQIDIAQEVFNKFDSVRTFLVDQGYNVSGMIPINFSFFGLDLSKVPSLPWNGLSWLIFIPLVSAAAAYLTSWVSQKFSGQKQASGMKGMMLLSPVLSLVFGFTLPAAMGIYWISQSLFTIPQEYFLTKYYKKKFDAEDARKAELEARRKAAEELQKEEDRKRRAERIAEAQANKRPKKYHVAQAPKPSAPKSGSKNDPAKISE